MILMAMARPSASNSSSHLQEINLTDNYKGCRYLDLRMSRLTRAQGRLRIYSRDVNVADLTYLVGYLFTGGPDPAIGCSPEVQ